MCDFDRNKYKVWPTYILECFRPVPVWLRPLVLVALLFFVGFFLTMRVNFHYEYRTGFAVGVGLFGILYAFFLSTWMPSLYIDKLLRAKSLFDISDRDYYSLLDRWLSRGFSNKVSLIWAFVGVVAVSVALGILGPYIYSHSGLRFLRFLPPEWYRDSYITKLLSLEIHWFFVIALIITGSRFLIFNIFLMKELSTLRIVFPPKLTEIEYKSLANFNLLFFSNWCVGAALFIVGTYMVTNVIAIAATILLTLIGRLTFAVPQCYLYRSLRTVKEELMNMIKETDKEGNTKYNT